MNALTIKPGRKRNSGLLQRLAAVAASLLADPTRSTRSLAREHRLRQTTVAEFRAALASRGAIIPNPHGAPYKRGSGTA